MEETGKRLKDAREKMKLTQSEVCDKLHIAKVQTLSAYERGVNNPPIDVLKDMAVLYGVSTDWILFGREADLKREKGRKDYIANFVEAMEKLGFVIDADTDYNGNPTDGYSIHLSCRFDGIAELFAALYRFQSIRGDIKEDEYFTLVSGKIDRLAQETNDFAEKVYPPVKNPFGDNEDLPF